MGDIKDFFIFIICHSWHSLFFYIKYVDVANCDIKNLHCRHYQKAWPLYLQLIQKGREKNGTLM